MSPNRNSQSRIIVHFDIDAFYVGCERELNPSALLGVPVAVSQYNPYGTLRETSADEVDRRLIVRPGKPVEGDTNGSLIAVSYEARAASVKRNDRGRDAVRKCDALRIVQVPVRHGKADLTMYRDASCRVLNKLVESIKSNALSKKSLSKIRVEKASIDEIYIDLTSCANEMAEKVIEERDKSSSSYWQEILDSFGASNCTTIGGVEDMNDANALAANSLSKDELRRGSHFQVLDSTSTSGEALDQGSRAWWRRCLSEWSDTEIRLAAGAALAAKARSDVEIFFTAKAEDGTEGETFTLSAGVSTNKTLSKLASGMKKPNRQTLINPDDDALQKLFHPLPIGRIKGLGGKFGVKVSEALGVSTVGDLAKLSLVDIEKNFPSSPDNETAQFLFNISRGICTEEVDDRTLAKSIGCGKTFRNHLALDSTNEEQLKKWAGELCGELTERLSVDRRENKRTPKVFGVSVHLRGKARSASRSTPAPRSYEKYIETATKLIRQIVGSSQSKSVEGLTVFVSSFVEVAGESSSIMAAFGRVPKASECQSVASKVTPQKREKKDEPKRSLKTLWGQSENVKKLNESSGETKDEAANELDLANDDVIDPDILSQLPPSIQAEIRLSSRNHGAGIKLRPEKKSGINSWLSKTGTSSSARAAARKEEPKNTVTNGVSTSKAAEPFALPHVNDIDKETLAELPADIREAVMRDIAASTRSTQQQGNKRKRIDSFFVPSRK